MFEKTDAVNEYNLSIRISSDGFSLYIQDANNKTILSKVINIPDLYTLPKNEITSLFQAEADIIFSDYNEITLIVETDNFTFIPKPIFKAADIDNYYYFQYPKDKNSIVIFNYINPWNAVNVFAIPADLEKALEELFPDNEIQHQLSYLLTEKVKSREEQIHVWKRDKSIDIVVIKNNDLTLAASYDYQTTEDIVYYILRLVKEFKLDAESVKLRLHQPNSKDDLYNILLLYIKYCKIIPLQ